jgi:hypothetical protein
MFLLQSPLTLTLSPQREREFKMKTSFFSLAPGGERVGVRGVK